MRWVPYSKLYGIYVWTSWTNPYKRIPRSPRIVSLPGWMRFITFPRWSQTPDLPPFPTRGRCLTEFPCKMWPRQRCLDVSGRPTDFRSCLWELSFWDPRSKLRLLLSLTEFQIHLFNCDCPSQNLKAFFSRHTSWKAKWSR